MLVKEEPKEDGDPPREPPNEPGTSSGTHAATPKRILALEFMCGRAMYTAKLLDLGFDARGLGFSKNRHTPVTTITEIDLSTEHGKTLAWKLLESENLVNVHFAPMC